MPTATDTARDTQVPLAVDLDGALIRTDMMWESLARLLRENPLSALASPLWLLRGRAHFKQQLATRVRVDAVSLPYHEEFLDWLRDEKRAGRKLVLATASDIEMARPVAQHVGLFDEVLASDGTTNLRDNAKLTALTQKFGARGFDYAGNSSPDLAIWSGSREAIVVNASGGLAQKASARTKVGRVFPATSSITAALLKSLRPHQWLKNLILLVPVLTAHKLSDPHALTNAALAILSFCLCASAVYLSNDILDLEADRHHPTKRNRPFASGLLPLQFGLFGAPVLLLAALIVALTLSWNFAAVGLLYFALASGYSLRLKQVALLDVFVLAGLYTLRLIAGHVATGIAYSPWLLVFSMFIFLSLALLKRFLELKSLRQQNRHEIKGRGYTAADLELVTTLGLVSGYLAVLVMALYVNSEQVRVFYAHPLRLLLVCPMLLFWVSRVWFLAHRGQVHDDPTAFALKDWVSYTVGALTLAVMWLATGH
ncbi:MAG: UbiA family prenyltransferase [Verrucomicrobia bacterium]|jgi:4-hydroxybenzoate polyprenyltransferase|nr:UbiA family prenyltransferase [Verrucomicrobiota bacterium]